MSLNIELLRWNRERALGGCPEASATYTFSISDGPLKARAEVRLTDGGIELIKRAGKDAKAAARLAWSDLSLKVRSVPDSNISTSLILARRILLGVRQLRPCL